MKRLSLVALTALLISLQLVALGCRKMGPSYVVYVNQTDEKLILGFEMAPQPLRQWWQGAAREAKQEGNFFRRDANDTIAGWYSSDANVYVLQDPILKELRFSIQPDLSLRDETGTVWRRSPLVERLHTLASR